MLCAASAFLHCGGKAFAAMDTASEDATAQQDSTTIESGDADTYVCGSNVCTSDQLCLIPCTVLPDPLVAGLCADRTAALAAGPCIGTEDGNISPCFVNCCDNVACGAYLGVDAAPD